MSRHTTIWALAALLGIVLTAAITWGTSQLTSQRIGISSEPISAASGLAPRQLEPRATRRTGRRPSKRTHTQTTSAPPAPAASPAPAPATAPTNEQTASAPQPAAPAPQVESAPQSSGAPKSPADDGGGGGGGGKEGSGHGRDD